MANDKKERLTKYLPVKLTDKEKLSMGRKLATVQKKHRELEEEKKEIARQYKERIDSHREAILVMSECLESGNERRPVDCESCLSFDRGVYELVRLDTGEVIEERTLTEAERQLSFE